jgi:hypothetical protein
MISERKRGWAAVKTDYNLASSCALIDSSQTEKGDSSTAKCRFQKCMFSTVISPPIFNLKFFNSIKFFLI